MCSRNGFRLTWRLESQEQIEELWKRRVDRRRRMIRCSDNDEQGDTDQGHLRCESGQNGH